MACDDVRRMLSDGDGRVLRGRGVRAHLRSCPDCRASRPTSSSARGAARCSRRRCRPAARRRCSRRCSAGRRPSCWPASRSRVADDGRRDAGDPCFPRPARAGTSVERVAATGTASPVTSARVPGRAVASSGSRASGAAERAAPLVVTQRPRRRARKNEPTASVPTPAQTPVPVQEAVEEPAGARPPAETTPPPTPVEAPAIERPGRRSRPRRARPARDRPLGAGTPPGQAKKQQPVPARTNPGKPSTPPAANPGNGNQAARTTATGMAAPAGTGTGHWAAGPDRGPGQQRQRPGTHRRQRQRHRRPRRSRQWQRRRKRERRKGAGRREAGASGQLRQVRPISLILWPTRTPDQSARTRITAKLR